MFSFITDFLSAVGVVFWIGLLVKFFKYANSSLKNKIREAEILEELAKITEQVQYEPSKQELEQIYNNTRLMQNMAPFSHPLCYKEHEGILQEMPERHHNGLTNHIRPWFKI